jgi:NADH dehydrogenase FAD-containing subunit
MEEKNKQDKNVTLISSSPLLSSYGITTMKKIRAIALSKGLKFYENESAQHIGSKSIVTDKDRTLDFSKVLTLTGPVACRLFKKSGLSTDSKGFLLVEDTLQSKYFPYIFRAGDSAALTNYPLLPKNGVIAVRQGPILWENLKRYMTNSDNLLPYKPQKRFLSIISTGNKDSLMTYGFLTFYGKWAWKTKHAIDQKFMNKHKSFNPE